MAKLNLIMSLFIVHRLLPSTFVGLTSAVPCRKYANFHCKFEKESQVSSHLAIFKSRVLPILAGRRISEVICNTRGRVCCCIECTAAGQRCSICWHGGRWRSSGRGSASRSSISDRMRHSTSKIGLRWRNSGMLLPLFGAVAMEPRSSPIFAHYQYVNVIR